MPSLVLVFASRAKFMIHSILGSIRRASAASFSSLFHEQLFNHVVWPAGRQLSAFTRARPPVIT